MLNKSQVWSLYLVSFLVGLRTYQHSLICTFTTMYALMSYHISLFSECLITHITIIRALTTMYALMCYFVTLVNESLTTHFT